MRAIYMVIYTSILLCGCHGKSAVQPAQITATLKPAQTQHAPAMLEQYRFGLFTVGGWVNQKSGQRFHSVQPQNSQAAIVYMYRPDSAWNRQEVVASSLFINAERIPSLLNNHYYWIELPAGTYRLSSSRPLGVQHFQKPKYLDFTVQAGQSYFIKYDEENLSTRRDIAGPLNMVPEKIGLNEIAFTQWKSQSFNFVAQDQHTGKVRKKAQKIKPEKYEMAAEVQLTQPFKIWDPRTW